LTFVDDGSLMGEADVEALSTCTSLFVAVGAYVMFEVTKTVATTIAAARPLAIC
jgi:hypothetical protein